MQYTVACVVTQEQQIGYFYPSKDPSRGDGLWG